APPTSDPSGSTRVLLVDDDDLVRETIAAELESAGHAVVAASGGTQALELLAGGDRVDILVTDLSMPGMDGLSLIRSAHAHRPDLPALLLTGYAGDGAAVALSGTAPGKVSLLRKPVIAAQLVDQIAVLVTAPRH